MDFVTIYATNKHDKNRSENLEISHNIYNTNIHFFLLFQLKYKRRVYKMLQMDEKQLKTINSKANHKKFLENVGSNNVDKINKMCVKGLDPNFHCENSGGNYIHTLNTLVNM